MRCFLITESELHSLGLVNGLAAGSLSLMSFFIALAIDISKDVAFSGQNSEMARLFTDFVRPACVGAALIFLIGAIALYWWRSNMVAIIKKETRGSKLD
jgi:hypothetical protein